MTNPHDLRELAWAARAFGQSKALAVSNAMSGNQRMARYFGAEARKDWQRLSNYLRAQGGFVMSAAACPACGQSKQLPRITPERLFFLSGPSMSRFAVMPDGSGGELYVIAVEGAIHTIRPGEWAHYQRLCEHAEDFAQATA